MCFKSQKMKKFSKNSWHARLYRFCYSDKLLTNYCAHWRMILVAIIFAIPAAIFTLPYRLAISTDKISRDDKFNTLNGNILLASTILNVILFAIFCMISMWFHLNAQEDTFWGNVRLIGSVCWGTLVVFGVGALITTIKIKMRKTNTLRQKSDSFFKTLWETHKDKVCPKMEWF